MKILLFPPIAFMIYLGLVGLLFALGQLLNDPHRPNPLKTSSYASGEALSPKTAVPGYRPFFVVALFFAVLHLGVLMLASSQLSLLAALYLVGLMLALLVLILG